MVVPLYKKFLQHFMSGHKPGVCQGSGHKSRTKGPKKGTKAKEPGRDTKEKIFRRCVKERTWKRHKRENTRKTLEDKKSLNRHKSKNARKTLKGKTAQKRYMRVKVLEYEQGLKSPEAFQRAICSRQKTQKITRANGVTKCTDSRREWKRLRSMQGLENARKLDKIGTKALDKDFGPG